MNRKTYKNIIIITGMVHKAHVWVTIPMVRHHGRIFYKDTLVLVNRIKTVKIKYIIFSDIPN